MLQFDWTISIPVVISLGTLVFAWLRTRRQDVEVRLHEGSKRMDGLELRVASLEQAVGSLPAKDDMHQLELSLSEIIGEMKAMAASQRSTNDMLRRVETTLSRHEDHLMDQGTKR